MTTPNFGWPLIQPTDLVTDLPADFEAFADAVDADLDGLNGGTTGQVLTKASATDYDFAFAALPAAGGMSLLSSGAGSGAETNITGIVGTFKNLHLIVRNFIPSSAGDFLSIRFNGNVGTNYLSRQSTSTGLGITYDQTSIFITRATDTAGTSLTAVDIFDYANAVTRKLCRFNAITPNTDAAGFNLMNGSGTFNSSAAITSLTIKPLSGTATFDFLLYGVN